MEKRTILSLIFLVCFLSIVSSSDEISYKKKPSVQLTEAEYQAKFAEWMVEYKKTYANQAEQDKRYAIFKDNLDYINKYNAKIKEKQKKNGNHDDDMELGLNQFSDLTNDEFKKMMFGN